MAGLYGIALIFVLVAVSGFVAYVGDIVGRRLGRKRLSLFGMRPRHTAIAVSVLAGMVITILTLGVAMLVSEDVKDGLMRVSEMRRQQGELSRELKLLQRKMSQLEEARQEADRQLGLRKSELDTTRAHLEQAHTDLEAAQSEIRDEQKKLRSAQAAVRKREEVLARLAERNNRLVEQQGGLRQDIANLQAWTAMTTEGLRWQRQTPTLFGWQQPLSAMLIQGGRPKSEIRKELDAFVAGLDEMARAAGARPRAEGEKAVLVGGPLLDEDKESLTWVGPDEVLDAVAEQIHTWDEGVIVRAYSVVNTYMGEPVPIDFDLFRNKLVFRRGEVLAETILDGRLSEPSLMTSLVRLLREEVGARARTHNIMPRPGASGELFGSTREAVGQMSYEELFAVMARMREIGGPVRVAAVASDDTWTIGPLEVDLRVDPITAAAPD